MSRLRCGTQTARYSQIMPDLPLPDSPRYPKPLSDLYAEWQRRIDELWELFSTSIPAEQESVIQQIRSRIAELAPDDPRGMFELASTYDASDHEDQAVPYYRQAIAGGLDNSRHRKAVIQLASSLRVLGEPEEAEQLLRAELDRPVPVDDHETTRLRSSVQAFLALCLADLRREREGIHVALSALTEYLPLYQRALHYYCADLLH